MRIIFSPEAFQAKEHFKKHDPKKDKKIKALIKDILLTPYSGIGKPEALKYDLSGCWSRRISREHRLVYMIEGDILFVVSCRYHYPEEPNKLTRTTMEKADRGEDVFHAKDADDLFRQLGI